MTIDVIISKWERINIVQAVGDAIELTARDLVLLQQTQMLLGQNRFGEKIGKYKSNKYAALKYAQNPLAGFGFVDLFKTGEFQRDIFVDVRDRSVIIDSAAPATPQLLDRYSDDIFGLNPKTTIEYSQNYLQPAFVQIIKKLFL